MPDSSVTFYPLDTERDSLASNYLFVAAVTFLFYDHLITWDDEVNHLWRRPKTKSAYWFFLNRYLALGANIASVTLDFATLRPEVNCRQFYLFRQILLICQQVLIAVLLTLRIYALYSCSSRVLVFMVGSATILAGIGCYSLFGQNNGQIGNADCRVGLSELTAIRIASAWEALFVYDSIIFGLTMARSWKTRHEQGNITESPIVYLIFRDGAAYFGVMALANLANILTFYLCGPLMKGGLSVFASAVSVTMMSRLMLNLHRMTVVGIYSTRGANVTLTNTNLDFHANEAELDTRPSQSGNAAHTQDSVASTQ